MQECISLFVFRELVFFYLLFDLKLLPEKFNPNYSSESEANRMNVRLTKRCSSGNPDLEIPNFGEYNEPKSVGIT